MEEVVVWAAAGLRNAHVREFMRTFKAEFSSITPGSIAKYRTLDGKVGRLTLKQFTSPKDMIYIGDIYCKPLKKNEIEGEKLLATLIPDPVFVTNGPGDRPRKLPANFQRNTFLNCTSTVAFGGLSVSTFVKTYHLHSDDYHIQLFFLRSLGTNMMLTAGKRGTDFDPGPSQEFFCASERGSYTFILKTQQRHDCRTITKYVCIFIFYFDI